MKALILTNFHLIDNENEKQNICSYFYRMTRPVTLQLYMNVCIKSCIKLFQKMSKTPSNVDITTFYKLYHMHKYNKHLLFRIIINSAEISGE